MSPAPAFTVTYWGVTGTFPDPLRPAEVTEKLVATLEHLANRGALAALMPGPNLRARIGQLIAEAPFHLRSTYGGNTTCIEVQTPDGLFILDCGSGFRELGRAIDQRWNTPGFTGNRTAHVLVSHPHMDHTFATPYFAPYFDERNSITILGTRAVISSLEAVLSPSSALSRTYFPPTFEMMKAIKQFRPIEADAEIRFGATHIRTCSLRHPGGCLGYRIEWGGKAFVFATDHEQTASPDPILTTFAHGADLLYTEGQYTQAEYDGVEALPDEVPLKRHGWGHTPVEGCVKTAAAAAVRVFHLGHRDPTRSDEDLARMEEYARGLLRAELVASGRPADDCALCVPYEGLMVML